MSSVIVFNSPFSCCGVPLQISDNGYSVSGPNIVIEANDWRSRDSILQLISASTQSAEAVTISGKRKLVRAPDLVGVPVNNSVIIDDLLSAYVSMTVSLSGTHVSGNSLESVISTAKLCSDFWKERKAIIAKLSAPNLEENDYVSLRQQLLGSYSIMTAPDVTFNATPGLGISGKTTFLEGQGPSFTTSLGIISSFKIDFSIVREVTV